MADETTLLLNGAEVSVSSTPDTPLLYVLSDELQLQGPRFGCGLAQCGSCSVLVDGVETRSCVMPLSAVAGKRVTTLEGLPALYAEAHGLELSAHLPARHGFYAERALGRSAVEAPAVAPIRAAQHLRRAILQARRHMIEHPGRLVDVAVG